MSVKALPHWHLGPISGGAGFAGAGRRPKAVAMETSAMDKKSVEGKLDKLGGKVKEVGGVVTNDRDLEAEGKIDRLKGNVKESLGNLREGIKNKLDDLDDPNKP